jgi:hypothetical protein
LIPAQIEPLKPEHTPAAQISDKSTSDAQQQLEDLFLDQQPTGQAIAFV